MEEKIFNSDKLYSALEKHYNIGFKTTSDAESDMIGNMSDKDLDKWVSIDDSICRRLKTNRRDCVVLSGETDVFGASYDSTERESVYENKKYGVYSYKDMLFATDYLGNCYFPDEKSMKDTLAAYVSDNKEWFEDVIDTLELFEEVENKADSRKKGYER